MLLTEKYPKWSSHGTNQKQPMEQTCELDAEIFCPDCTSPLNLSVSPSEVLWSSAEPSRLVGLNVGIANRDVMFLDPPRRGVSLSCALRNWHRLCVIWRLREEWMSSGGSAAPREGIFLTLIKPFGLKWPVEAVGRMPVQKEINK